MRLGIMGIVEKFTNGGVVIAIQGLSEKLLVDETVTQSEFYRYVFRYGVVGFGILCIIGALGLRISLHYRPISRVIENDEKGAKEWTTV